MLYLSNKTISKWETGRGLPETTMIPKLSEALSISAEEILNAIKQTNESKPELKSEGLKINTMIASSIIFLGYLLMISASALGGIGVLTFFLGIACYVFSGTVYFALEHYKVSKYIPNYKDVINKYRKRFYLIWYLISLAVPLSIFGPLIMDSRRVLAGFPYSIIMIETCTIIYVIARFFFIKK